MDIHLILSLALGLCACLYMLRKIIALAQKSDQNSHCSECNNEEGTVHIDK